MKHNVPSRRFKSVLVNLMLSTLFIASCGRQPTESRLTNSEDVVIEDSKNDAPSLSVEDVVNGFEFVDELEDQVISEADRKAWEKSLVQEDKLKPEATELLVVEDPSSFGLEDTQNSREIVDLRSNDSGIRNQGSEGTCTAFATVASMENLVKRFYGESVDLSERHHWTTYANYQTTTSLQRASAGPIVSEQTWAYNGRRPSNVSGLGIAKIDSYKTTKLSLAPVIESLRKGEPVVIAVGVLNTLMNPKQGGIVTGGRLLAGAGHAMAVTGAIIDSKVPGGGYFVVKNSWGKNWGDKGYGYVSFDYCQRAWCSAYSIGSVTLFDKGNPLPKKGDSIVDGTTPNSPAVPPSPPVPSNPVVPEPSVPQNKITAADFSVKGFPSNRRGFFGMTKYFLNVSATPEILKQVKSIHYGVAGQSYGVLNGALSDVGFDSRNLASPDLRTFAGAIQTDETVITLRNGEKIKLKGIQFKL